ncbi:head-tail connector protein [Jiangella gansuensis]|uniref:head-tail connector protein n=1 Tax=Jiangella gansuensis TaxID=281473 RepID=UPI00047AB20D|nr:head-tail connector protein [Jiangella gansuensis]
MAEWATPEQARDSWSDAPDDPALLGRLLNAAQEMCELYAPALATGEPVPARYTEAVILQAREVWQAMDRDGDVLGFDGEYAVRVRPLSASVKSLLRPPRGRPSFGSWGSTS